jgi:hypothetical protein
MAEQYGPWTIQEKRQKYQNSFINVREDQVLQPDGQPGRYSTVTMKPGVAILPIDSEGNRVSYSAISLCSWEREYRSSVRCD